MTVGHGVDVSIRLNDTDRARMLAGVFRAGSRSVMFRFPDAEEADGGMLGAIIESLEQQDNGLLRVHLLFWNDLARIYAVPGARFDVWYAKTVGTGIVLPR